MAQRGLRTGGTFEQFTVAVVSVRGRFFAEWPAKSWQQAIALARQARKEFPSREVFVGDGTHVWRIDEIDDNAD